MKSENSDLEFKRLHNHTDKELIDELSSRFDDFIMAGRKLGYGGKDKVKRHRFWKGDYDVCIGLLHGTAMDTLLKLWGIKPEDIDYDA